MKQKFSLNALVLFGCAAISGAAFAHAAPTDKATAAAAAAADFKAGAAVRDSKGVQVATIVSADADKVVLDTGQTKIGVPTSFFVKNSQGVALNITAGQFNQAVAKAHARAEAAKAQTQAQGTTQPEAQQPAQPKQH